MIMTTRHPFITLSQQLQAICQPLELFAFHHFTYLKRYDDGSGISLSNKPQWIEDYYNLNLFQSSFFEAKPSCYQAKSDIWIGDYDLAVYHHGKQYYNTGHSISIIEPQNEACEFFLFATTPDNYQAINYLASNMDILYHFIAYFKDRAYPLLQKAQQNRLMLASLKRDSTPKIMDSNSVCAKTMSERKKQFYRMTTVYKYILESGEFEGVKITQRELGCIVHLLNNKTAAETAQLMNLSCRTIEFYLENIRNKLNCNTKMELHAKFKNNKFINSLVFTS